MWVPRLAARILLDPATFARAILGVTLRPYQVAPARAIARSVLRRQGLHFAVLMARQAGKNELSACLEAYLLNLFARCGGTLVKAAPTYQPQLLTSQERLTARLDNPWNRGHWRVEHGHTVRLGEARAVFLSAQPDANVVGATADILLECDEAQDVHPDRWDKAFAPMAAAENATVVFYGTPWTRHTLLGRVLRELAAEEARDGIQRVFRADWQVVAAAHLPYGKHVARELARLGQDHPLFRTQYALEEVDDTAGMFPPARQARMRGDHPRQEAPEPGRRYAFLLDPAGVDWSDQPPHPERDLTALTVVEVGQERLPMYRVVHRRGWRGKPHPEVAAALLDLVAQWNPWRVVVDATGVGTGLASWLQAELGERVLAVTFSAARKSATGWTFLALCDAGRVLDHRSDGSPEQAAFWEEVRAAQYALRPGQQLAWGAPPGGHDDWLLSLALVTALEEERAPAPAAALLLPEGG
ncbi:MAG: phage terminase large subunit family protein [Anaerolineae bacterium]